MIPWCGRSLFNGTAAIFPGVIPRSGVSRVAGLVFGPVNLKNGGGFFNPARIPPVSNTGAFLGFSKNRLLGQGPRGKVGLTPAAVLSRG